MLMLIAFVGTWAQDEQPQKRSISASLFDKNDDSPVIQATVQLLHAKDSSYVTGTASNMDGDFTINVPAKGKYIIKVTNIGYKQLTRNVTVADGDSLVLGELKMEPDAYLLKEVVAKGVAARVVVKEDTFVYNAAAYRTPEGSVIEELVKRLPGAQVDDDGKITINGKEVKKVKVDGKEFMTGDTKTALKNLPTSIIDKIKAYDEKSDLAKMTGVDDGEEETVLDFGIKKGMNKGYLGNIDIAGGTQSRYAGRAMVGYMKDNARLMVFGNMNNTGDQGFGRGGGGRGMLGLQTSKNVAMNYNYEKKDKINIDVFGRWEHRNSDSQQQSSTENFVSTVGSFTNSKSTAYSRSNTWFFGGRLEWKPDTMTTILIRPSFTNTSNDNSSESTSMAYNRNPTTVLNPATGTYVTDALDAASMSALNKALYDLSKNAQIEDPTAALDSILVNRRNNRSLSYSTNTNFSIHATVSRKLSSNGRNVTLQGRYNTSNSDSESLSTQEVTFYRPSSTDSISHTNRYNVTPTKNKTYQLSFTYSEPIARATFLQLRYMFRHNKSTSDRSTYDFSGNEEKDFGVGLPLNYRSFDAFLNPYLKKKPLSGYYDENQSKFSEYDNNVHEIELSLKRTTNKYNLNVGVMLQPQNSKLSYKYLGLDTVTTRTVSNFTPTLRFRYRFNKQKNLRVDYRGTTSQPSMTDLLPITDNTDVLNVTMGNPGLKPSFTNNFRLQYNNFVQRRFQSVMSFINFTNTRNSVSNMVRYDAATGGRTTQPMNINGTWNISGSFMYNTALDTVGLWNISTVTNAGFNNRASYVYLDKSAESTKNYVRTTGLSERLGFSYRNSWIEVELNGEATYAISRNKLQPTNNLDTWEYNYGTDITLNAPWGMSFSTSGHMTSRRGYSESSMNTDEFIWNAQISQGFLKGKPLTVMLQWYDILNQKSSFTRSISATQISDTWYNSINSYGMVHVVYRFNAFGGKEARRGGPDDGPGGERRGKRGGDRGGFGGPGGGRGGFGGGPRF